VDSPEHRALVARPWLFGRIGLIALAFVAVVTATVLAADMAFLAACLLLVGLLARGWAAVAFTRLTLTRRTLASRAFCGDDLVLETSLSNPRPIPLPWIEVWEHLPLALEPEGDKERSYEQPGTTWVHRGISLWPYQRARWQRTLVCRKRGVFRLIETRLRAGDPFGFFEREHIVRDNVEVLVYPRVVPLRRLALPLHHPSFDSVSPRSTVTDPTRTATIRDYHPDDPQRLIHWPTTARRGTLQVRVLEPATSLRVSLVLDVRGFTFGIYRDELLEQALSALASIAVYAHDQGHPVAFLANAAAPVVLAPAASVGHLQQVLEAMARIEPRAGQRLVPWVLGDLPRGSTVVLAASEMTPDLTSMLATMHDAGFKMLTLFAATRTRAGGDLYLTPGCDVAAVLEGRA
jgi:uncharacterized protein (DUF58 family)